jgi:rod shape-determining protein MreC
MLTILIGRNNQKLEYALLNLINPIKQKYKFFTQDIENKSQSYLFQQETIEKLRKENRILRKKMLEQVHYIKQVKDIYTVLPELKRIPVENISIVETISYVKLNSFSRILLTKPKILKQNKLYGLIQGTVAAGIAKLQNNQLYGYLTSDHKCKFSVVIGKDKVPGIAMGVKQNEMIVKFIPKWHKIVKGDRVVTSGMDGIFFADIPVGIVTKVELQSAYTVAYIRTYSDVYHPKTYFVINDANVDLVQMFDSNKTKLKPYYIEKQEYLKLYQKSLEHNNSLDNNLTSIDQNETVVPILSSIPSREDKINTIHKDIENQLNGSAIDQTKDDVVEPEVPIETIVIKPKPIIHKTRKKQRRRKRHRKPAKSTLDLF